MDENGGIWPHTAINKEPFLPCMDKNLETVHARKKKTRTERQTLADSSLEFNYVLLFLMSSQRERERENSESESREKERGGNNIFSSFLTHSISFFFFFFSAHTSFSFAPIIMHLDVFSPPAFVLPSVYSRPKRSLSSFVFEKRGFGQSGWSMD